MSDIIELENKKFMFYLYINKKKLIRRLKTLKEARRCKQKLLNLKFKENKGDHKLFLQIVNNKLYFHFSKTFVEKTMLENSFNDSNPELFDLSFVDRKYKLYNYEIIDNVLKNF